MCVCVRESKRVCVHVCMCVCVRAYVCVYVYVLCVCCMCCVCVCVHDCGFSGMKVLRGETRAVFSRVTVPF